MDQVKDREIIDFESNTHGDLLIYFTLATNTGMLHGGIGKNNFPCMSARGKAVDDDFIMPYEHIQYVKDFSVKSMTDTTSEHQISLPLLTKMSDHSILICSIDIVGTMLF